jgi:AraC-like DNA-binding protein/mannose-6-phosphate isomerase-like protein (cupin superfamily)
MCKYINSQQKEGDTMQIESALKENRRHGDRSFPVAVYQLDIAPGEQVLECHWHEECEFFVMLEGSALFQIGTHYFQIKAGEAVYIHSGEIHAAHTIDGQACSYAALVFDANFFASSGFDSIQSQYILPWIKGEKMLPFHFKAHDSWSNQMINTLRDWTVLVETKPKGYELLFKSQFYMLLYEIEASQQWIKPQILSNQDAHKLERITTVLTYIDKHYAKKIAIKELAELINMSEGHFCRFFKSYVHKTPIQYMNALRVRKAEQLLLLHDKKIIDVALEVGFDHFSYFIKVFRDIMNCTPSEYRKRSLIHEEDFNE